VVIKEMVYKPRVPSGACGTAAWRALYCKDTVEMKIHEKWYLPARDVTVLLDRSVAHAASDGVGQGNERTAGWMRTRRWLHESWPKRRRRAGWVG